MSGLGAQRAGRLRGALWARLRGALGALTLVVALVSGCGIPRDAAPGEPGATFPHPDGYELSHATVIEGGSAPCGDCHGLREGDPVGGALPAAPSCRSCHASYPHPASFSHGEVHAAARAADPAACAACHGVDGARAAGGSERGRCTSCHSTYPHAEGWSDGAAHGAATRERGQPACLGCHGPAGAAIEGASCVDCHAPPHPEGFADPSQHGAAADLESCATCHSSDSAAPDRRTCASCHDLYPHPEDWSSSHLAAVDSRGRRSCTGCHEGGLPGPALPATCGRGCHGGAP